MKKIYLFSGLLLSLLVSISAFAQNACNPANPPIVRNISYVINGQQVCAVYVEHMLPNSPVTLFGAGLTVIPSASGTTVTTDATGFACFVYPCNRTPVRVSTCNVQGCCSAFVPAAAALPMKVIRFTAQMNNAQTVTLNWSSAMELNSNSYIIERSADGKNFEAVGTVDAAGNSALTLHYTYTDQLPAAGAWFYRLRQVDIDRKYEFSKVVYVNSGKSAGVVSSVFPNPFTNELQLVGITAADLNPNTVRLFSVAGQEVAWKVSGSNAISIANEAPRGLYILRVKDQVFKLVKR